MPVLTIHEQAPAIDTLSVTGHRIDLAAFRGERKVLVKFHRFSGCPIAQAQLHELIEHQNQLSAAGVETIVILHNTREKVAGAFPESPGLHLVADPHKTLYRSYGAAFLWRKLLSPATWRATIASIAHGYLPRFTRFQGGIVGVPSDFLIDENGLIAALHYGCHYGDSWSVTDVLEHAATATKAAPADTRAATPEEVSVGVA